MNIETCAFKKCRVHEFEKLVEAGGCQAVDVRETEEFFSERIAGVKSRPLSELSPELVEGLSKDKAVYLVCRDGDRSAQAAARLKRFGFRDLNVVDGGMREWVQAGKPIVRG